MLWRRDWLQLNKTKSMESRTKLMSWYWKGKPNWRKDLITYNSHPRITFLFNCLVIIWRGRGFRLKLDVQGQGVGRILDVAGQGGWRRGVLKIGQFSCTSYVYHPLHNPVGLKLLTRLCWIRSLSHPARWT